MSMKIVVSKPGYNALTETNPNNLNYSSDYDTLKYYLEGTKTITVPDSGGSPDEYEETVVTHNLGYKPFFTVMIENSDSSPTQYYLLPYGFGDAFVYIFFDVYVTDTLLIFRAKHTGISDDVDVKLQYKIYRNNLNL